MKFRSIKHFIWSFKNRKSFKNWRARNFSPPSPDVIKHQILANNNLKDSLWIETGTYYGETTKLLSKISKKTIEKEFISMASMNCWISEEDIGKMCSFLISEDAARISGQIIAVDGNATRLD